VTAGCPLERCATPEWYKTRAMHQQQISMCWRQFFTTRSSHSL